MWWIHQQDCAKHQNTLWKKDDFGRLAFSCLKKCSLTNRSTILTWLTALVSKYQIYDEDCLGISSIRSLLSSLSSLLTRPTMAEVMVETAILARQATSAMATLAAANPPSSQWQPPSASIITVFFQPNRKYLGNKEVNIRDTNIVSFVIQFCSNRDLLIVLYWRLPSSKTSHHWAKEPGVEGHGDEHEEVGESEGDEMEEGLEGVRPRKQVRPQNSDAASRWRVGRRWDNGGFVTLPLRRLGRHGYVVVRNRTRQTLG